MHLCTIQEIPEILHLLRSDIPNCFYMYVDIARYGIEHPAMRVWLARGQNGNINAVVMKYFNSMQVYTLSGADMEAIATHIQVENVPIITGTADACETIMLFLSPAYSCSNGWIFEVDHCRLFNCPDAIETAREEDLPECAALVCSDPQIGGHYDIRSLTRQFIERQREGMGRNYLIRKEGQIIAHVATYAEFENLVMVGGLIVHKKWRNKPYGLCLSTFLFNNLLKENKHCFTTVNTEQRAQLWKNLGASKFWRNGKIRYITK